MLSPVLVNLHCEPAHKGDGLQARLAVSRMGGLEPDWSHQGSESKSLRKGLGPQAVPKSVLVQLLEKSLLCLFL